MSGTTPELALSTAVDSDDTADYLTLSLADSLRTVDALFNAVSGHTHSGTHQGGPIASVPSAAIPDGSITGSKIADGSITNIDIANGTLTGSKFANAQLVLPNSLVVHDSITIWGGTTALAFGPEGDSSHYLQYAPAGQTNLLAWTNDFQAMGTLTAGTGMTINSNSGPLYFGADHTVDLYRYSDGTVGTVLRAASPNGLMALQFVPEPGAGYFAHSNRSGAPSNEVRAESHLYVPGSIWCTNVQQVSNEDLKSNIVNISPTDALSMVLDARVQPFEFTYTTPPPTGSGQMVPESYGFGAQAMSQVCPEVVALGTVNGTPNQPMAIDYPSLVPILWGAVRALDARLKALGG